MNQQERKIYDKEYREKNKEHIKIVTHARYIKNRENALKYRKEYYETNKDLVLQKKRETITCECGKEINKNHKARHVQTLYHKDILKNKNS